MSPENYRPVSLTVVACRILERIIRDHLLDFVLQINAVHKNQSGFLPRRSALTNLIVFLDYVTKKLDNGMSVDVAYFDIAKAFDTIPHDNLLKKLLSLGLNRKLFTWVRSFLKDRIQYVEISLIHSNTALVSSGVPQWSVLGPLLFLLFFEDARVGGNTCLLKFAELFGVDSVQLQQDIDIFVQSIDALGLTLK